MAREDVSPRIAFFGSTTLLAKEIRSGLVGQAFPPSDVRLYDVRGEGTLGEFGGEALVVAQPDEETIGDLDLAFMCGSAAETAPYLDWPARHGFTAIDLSGASAQRADTPTIHTEINPGAIAASGAEEVAALICAPHAVSHNLATLASAAREAGTLVSLETVALRPASDMGDAGIDELYRQTIGVLNFGEIPREVSGRQLAFNVVPSAGAIPSRAEGFDARVRAETSSLLGLPSGSVRVASAFVPVFHGHALAVTLEFAHPCEPDLLTQTYGARRGIRIVADPAEFSPIDLAGEETVAVLEVRADADRPERIAMWAFCDNLKGGAALNAIRIAQRVIDLKRGARR